MENNNLLKECHNLTKTANKLIAKNSSSAKIKKVNKDINMCMAKIQRLYKRSLMGSALCENARIYDTPSNLSDFKLPFSESKYKSNIPDYLIDNTLLYKYQKKLGEGGYGDIYVYRARIPGKKSKYVTLKIQDDEHEKNILSLDYSRCSRHIVKSHDITDTKDFDNGYYYAVMEYMNGDLYRTAWNEHDILIILKTLAKVLYCLYNENLAYTDLKTPNILYRCIGKGKIKIFLGDIGSMNTIKENNKMNTHIATYPPAEYYNKATDVGLESSSIIWGLGILALQLSGTAEATQLLRNHLIHKDDYGHHIRKDAKKVNDVIDNTFAGEMNEIVKKLFGIKYYDDPYDSVSDYYYFDPSIRKFNILL